MGERMAFGKYIRREREGRDMTLTELARRVEVSIADLSRIERERENPPPDRGWFRPWPVRSGFPPMIFSPPQDGCPRTCGRGASAPDPAILRTLLLISS